MWYYDWRDDVSQKNQFTNHQDQRVSEITTEAPTPQTELTLATWKPEYEAKMLTLFEAFQKRYPNIKLKHISTPYTTYETSLAVQLKQDMPPDLMFLQPYSGDRLLFEQGYLEPLNELPGLTDAYESEALEPWTTEKNEIYGVPLSGVVHGIAYNMDILERLNLEMPKTWSELVEVADTLNYYGYIPIANSVGNSPHELGQRFFDPLFTNFVGGREGRLAYERGDRCFNDPQMVAAFSALSQLQPYLVQNNETIYQSQELFFSQKAPILFMGSWNLISLQERNLPFSWNVMPFPPPEGKPGYGVFHPDFAVGLNANSANKEAAQQFLQWLMTPEASEILVNEFAGNFALHKDSPPVRDPHTQAFLQLIEDHETDVRWTYPQLQEKIPTGKTLMEEGVVGILKGEMTPEEAANALQQGLAEWYPPAQVCGIKDTNESRE